MVFVTYDFAQYSFLGVVISDVKGAISDLFFFFHIQAELHCYYLTYTTILSETANFWTERQFFVVWRKLIQNLFLVRNHLNFAFLKGILTNFI